MGYYANGNGYITFSRRLTDNDVLSVDDILQNSCFDFDFHHGNKDGSSVDVWCYDKYHDDDVRNAIQNIADKFPVKEGCIEFAGEDDEHWRFLYDAEDNDWLEQTGHIVYDE